MRRPDRAALIFVEFWYERRKNMPCYLRETSAAMLFARPKAVFWGFELVKKVKRGCGFDKMIVQKGEKCAGGTIFLTKRA